MSLTKKVYLTISGYDIKLSDNLTFYQKDQLKLIFYINEYGIDYENNATARALMPVNPLNAILFIENPDGVDSVSSAKIEDNAVTFYLDSTHTQYVGVSRMQLRLFDQDGCAITLPHFTFEIRENIYGSGDVRFQNVVMVDQTGTVILTEDNDLLDVGDILTMGTEVAYPQVAKTIKELPIKHGLDGTEKLIVEDNEATKQAPLGTIVDEIKQNSQEKIREIESELAQTNAQLSPIIENQKPIYPTKMRYIYQFSDNDNNINTVQMLKSLGVNCVIIPREHPWQNSYDELKRVIDFLYQYGIYTAIECSRIIEQDSGYENELDFISKITKLNGVYGVYSLDEPVIRKVSKAKQIEVYNRIKSVTNKPVIISDVPCILGRDELFETYYTNESFDEYFMNCYFTHEPYATIKDFITEAVEKLHELGYPKGGIGANFPFWTEKIYPFNPTFETTERHSLAWRGLCNGNYGLFAYHHDTFTSYLKGNPCLQEMARRIPSLLLTNGESQFTTNKLHAPKGVVTSSSIVDGEVIITKKEGKRVMIKPETDENPSDALLVLAKSTGTAFSTISKEGKLWMKKEIETSRLNLSGGDVVTKIIRRAVSVTGGTIQPKGTLERHVSCNDISNAGAFAFGQPFSTSIPFGITWTCYPRANNSVTIRYINITDSPLEVETTTWFINIVVTE